MAIKTFTFYPKKEDENQRIDTFLKHHMEGFSRKKIQAIIAEGDVRIGYKKVHEFSERVLPKSKISVDVDSTKKYKEPIKHRDGRKVHVLHEDRDIIVIEKEAGVLSVPTARKEENTAIHHVNKYIKQKYNKKSSVVFIVHRLDKNTSGVMVFAKHKEAQKQLKKLFLDHSIERTYVAIVHGEITKKNGKIESYLSDDEDSVDFKMKSTTKDKGKHAVTHYTVRKQLNNFSFVQAKLETGKRNQIRVHFAEAGYPIMGDTKYKKSTKSLFDMPRLALHALELGFAHPMTGKKMIFKSTVPQVMKQFIEKYKK